MFETNKVTKERGAPAPMGRSMDKPIILALLGLFVATITTMTMAGQGNQQTPANSTQQGSANETQQGYRDKREKTVQATIQSISADAVTPREHFQLGGKVFIQVSMINTGAEPVVVTEDDDFFHYRLRLLKDGKPVHFPKSVLDVFRLKDKEGSHPISVTGIDLQPNQKTVVGILDLSKWYGALEPGQYQLTMKYLFRAQGKPIESNTTTFEVAP